MYEVRVKNPEVEFVISTVETKKDAMALISRCLKNRGVAPLCYCAWSTDDGKTTKVDYGSHTEFFCIKKVEENT